MKRPGKMQHLSILLAVIFVFLITGTVVSAETLQIRNEDPWKYGKYVGAYVNLFYGSSTHGSKLPKVITVSAKTVTANANNLRIRSGPGTNYQIIGSAGKGETFKLVAQQSGWYKVLLKNGDYGWISATYATITDNQASSKPAPDSKPQVPGEEMNHDAVVKGTVVNVRSGPDTSYSVVTKLQAGALVKITWKSAGWYKITTPDGKEGWVAEYLLSLKGSTPSRDGNVPPDTPKDDDDASDPAGNVGEKLTDIKTELGADYERVIISSEGTISYTVYNLSNPRRLVFDFANTEKNTLPDEAGPGEQWIGGVRIAQFSLTPMVTRVVIDLKRPAAYNTVLSEDQKTLTIELKEPSIKGKTIVIDPGHGGHDPGAIGVTGLKEKEVNLDIARRVAAILEQENANVIMTREEDVFVPLIERSNKANEVEADLFVSIHANSSESPSTNGTSTYYYAPSTLPGLYAQREARENLASKVQHHLVANLGIRDAGVRTANLSVLRNTTMPSILVETAFLSYELEEALLKTDEFRDKAAMAIAQGILEYFLQN